MRSSASLLAYVPTPQLLALMPANVQAWFKAYGPQTFNFVSTLPKSSLPFNAGGPLTPRCPAEHPGFRTGKLHGAEDAGGDLPQNTYELIGRADYQMTPIAPNCCCGTEGKAWPTLSGAIFASPYPQYNVGRNDL